MRLLRPLIVFLALVLAWQLFVEVSGVARFILPGPDKVGAALRSNLTVAQVVCVAREAKRRRKLF